MKLVTFVHNGNTRIGALITKDGQERVVDFQQADPSLPTDMLAFLQGGAATHSAAQKAIASATESLPLSTVKILAPIPRPSKIICIGLNYSDHAAETGQPIPKYPIVFSKYANTVIATGEAIVLPRVTNEVDYEAELGFVIGKPTLEIRNRPYPTNFGDTTMSRPETYSRAIVSIPLAPGR